MLWKGSSAYVTGALSGGKPGVQTYYGYNNQHTFLRQKTSLACLLHFKRILSLVVQVIFQVPLIHMIRGICQAEREFGGHSKSIS